MQSSLQQQLVAAQCFHLGNLPQIVFEGEGIRLFRLVGPAMEVAELAARQANVGIIDVAVDLVADTLSRDVHKTGVLRERAEFLERCVAIA